MHIPKAFCATDGLEMIIAHTGILVEVIATFGTYYKIYGDKYACPECRAEIVLPAAKQAAMHFDADYPAYSNIGLTVSMQ